LAEVLSVECNVSLAYDINTKKMLKYEVSAKYYLKNKEGTSEISKQKYLEIKSQWGVK